MNRGISGTVLKVLGARDYRMSVTSSDAVTENYLRLSFHAAGLLSAHPPHPTQWVRLWIPTDGDKVQQRGYTLVDPDPASDSFDIEFAIHDGPAARWAQAAGPGDVIEATVMGSKFAIPDPPPSEFLVFGDTASLPAVNSLLDAIGDTPARVWLEWQHHSDTTLPVHAGPRTEVSWIARERDGQPMRDNAEQVTCDPGAFAWIACDFATTRAISKIARGRLGLGKSCVKHQAYWK